MIEGVSSLPNWPKSKISPSSISGGRNSLKSISADARAEEKMSTGDLDGRCCDCDGVGDGASMAEEDVTTWCVVLFALGIMSGILKTGLLLPDTSSLLGATLCSTEGAPPILTGNICFSDRFNPSILLLILVQGSIGELALGVIDSAQFAAAMPILVDSLGNLIRGVGVLVFCCVATTG